MADYNLKTITADTDGPSADTELLFGSPDQSSGTPKPYSFAGIRAWIDSGQGFGNLRNRSYAFTDCISATAQDKDFIGAWTGTGAGISVVAIGSLNAFGVCSLDLGTAVGGKVSVNGLPTTVMKLGLGRTRFQTKLAVNILSTGTETFRVEMGFLDNFTGTPTDGVIFRYSHATNSGKWEAVCRSSGVETSSVVDTGVTVVAGAWQRFTVDVNAAGTSAEFQIDGAVVATITTNIPTGSGRELGYGVRGEKLASAAGTTAAVHIDWVEVEQLFSTPR